MLPSFADRSVVRASEIEDQIGHKQNLARYKYRKPLARRLAADATVVRIGVTSRIEV